MQIIGKDRYQLFATKFNTQMYILDLTVTYLEINIQVMRSIVIFGSHISGNKYSSYLVYWNSIDR